jgi:serine/threonine protein kinase
VLCTIGAGALLRVEDVHSGRPQTVMLLDPDQSCWLARLHDRRLLPPHPRLCALAEGAPRAVEHNDRTFYYVGAEALSGWTVLDEIARDGAIRPLSRAIRLCAEATEALACAHAAGLHHGHLEPGCLFVQTYAEEDEGHIKLLGVGLDVVASPSSRAARYLAPESPAVPQDGRATAGPEGFAELMRNDVFAMGAVLYHMIAGRAPGGELILPSLLCEASEELDDFILRALSPEPGHRFATATAFRDQLLGLDMDADRPSELTPAMRLCPEVGFA